MCVCDAYSDIHAKIESPRILEFSSHVPLLRESDVDNNGESVSLYASENHLYSEVNYSEPRNITVSTSM